jgi:hypothetical protein
MLLARRSLLTLLFALSSLPLEAARITSISPSSGPTTGGTVVTLTGDFWKGLDYGVVFGAADAHPATADEHTLTVVTPPHLPGTTGITLFEYDLFEPGGDVSFTFEGDPPDTLERMLVPLLTPPAAGAFGSLFQTDLRAAATATNASVLVYGLKAQCIDCTIGVVGSDIALKFIPPYFSAVGPTDVVPTGTPGTFFFVPREQVKDLALNLRVYDSSRSGANFGTELPIVRERDLVRGKPITLLGVPTDPRFRSTLRLYATAAVTVTITVADTTGGKRQHTVALAAGHNVYQPAYASFSDFPVSAGTATVTIDPAPDATTPIWAFVSVTNNETQLITTITPRP